MSGTKPSHRPSGELLGEVILEAFRNAVRQELDMHRAAGRPVPGADKDGHYYLKPDGTRVSLADGEEGTRQYQRALKAASLSAT